MKFFMDTYGLIEIAYGNKFFEKYLDNDVITSKLNMAELYYVLNLKYNGKTAAYFFNLFSKLVFDFPPELIPKAMELRFKYKDKALSYIDCIGYVFARENKRIFLTGDRAFQGMDGVEIIR